MNDLRFSLPQSLKNPGFTAVAVLTLALSGVRARRAQADDWPQWLGPQRDGVWREAGIVEKFPEGGPKVLWRTPIQGGYAGPAVADGRVYVTDRVVTPPQERVLCLDEKSGKVLWKHAYECRYAGIQYPAGPRTTPLVRGGKVYTLGAAGDLFRFDAATGKVIWSKNFRK